jgi:glycosyltransferase involved in cell wall biosynthesis
MKIAILNWRDQADPNSGGAELILHQLSQCWARGGHDVTIFSSRVPGEPAESRVEGTSVVRVGSLRRGSHHALAPGRVRSERPDVVLESINTIPYMLPWRSRGFLPYLSFVHQMAVDVWHAHLPPGLAGFAAAVERSLYRPYRARRFVTYSESTANDLRSVGIHDIHVVPQGGFGPRPLVEKASSPTFSWVGRLAANKRPDHAVEAFRLIRAEVPDARLRIIGGGEMYESIARTLPPGVELLGRTSHERVLQLMGESHLLLVTSVREGWGLVVTEANSVGTPAVAYDVPGLRDSVKADVTGRLTPPDPQSMARTALTLMKDPERYEEMRREAIEWGSRRSWEAMAGEVMHFLQRAIEDQPVGGPRQSLRSRPTAGPARGPS